MHIVEEQADGNGDFPTVKSPNPEDREALKIAIQKAKTEQADIVMGTDPDSDRVGVAVRQENDFLLLTGNQIGALLTDFVLSHSDLKSFKNPAIVKTVVTSELGAEIARKNGVSVFSTLTGFKYIGEKVTQFEAAKQKQDAERDYDFLFGYEESYGYLAGSHARDKDAAVSVLLIAEAAEQKQAGKTLYDRLKEIWAQYGYYLDALDSFTLSGIDGIEKIKRMMQALRNGALPFPDVETVTDYQKSVPAEPGFGNLPVSDVLKFYFRNGSWIAVRPSGTEPKIKVYYSIRADQKDLAEERLDAYRLMLKKQLGLA